MSGRGLGRCIAIIEIDLTGRVMDCVAPAMWLFNLIEMVS